MALNLRLAIVDVIKAALLTIAEQIEWAFIYGSVAKDEDTVSRDSI